MSMEISPSVHIARNNSPVCYTQIGLVFTMHACAVRELSNQVECPQL